MRKLWLLASVFTLFAVGVSAGPTWAVDNETVPPLLTITKSVAPADPCPLDVLTYTLVIGNLNSGRAHNTIVTDFVPANTTYVAGSTQVDGVTVADLAGGISPLSGGLNIGNVDPFGFPLSARRITFRVRVNAQVAAGVVISNSATVIAQELSAPVASNTVTSRVAACVLLAITKAANPTSVAPGGVVTYTITVRNDGNVNGTNVIVKDPGSSVAGLAYVPGSTRLGSAVVPDGAGGTSPLIAGVNVGTLAPGGSATVTFQRVAVECTGAGTLIPNTASVTSDQTPTPLNSNTVVVTILPATILSITKSVAPTSAAPGAVVTHTIAVRNTGNVTATNVIVTDPNPSTQFLQYVAGSTTVNGAAVPDAAGGASPLQAGLNVGSIASCATTTVTAQFTVVDCPTPGSTVTNTASVRSDQTASQSSNAAVLTFLPDITPPTIVITSPAAGAVFTPCSVITGTATITDLCPGVDVASIVVRIGGVVVPVTIVSNTGTVVTISFPFPNLEITPIGPLPAQLTITIDARDLLGNVAVTVTRTVTIDCTFPCARQLVIDASAAGAFKCEGADRQLVIWIDFAANTGNNIDLRRRALQMAIDCVTVLSREKNFTGNTLRGGRAIFQRDATSLARAQVIEDQLRCLLAKL
jgi:uncharacterized repeat protein (TIGR01451 family)